VKEVQHGHAHVLTKYDQGQEGLSFAKEIRFQNRKFKSQGILSKNAVVVGGGVCMWEGASRWGSMLTDTFFQLQNKMFDFPTPLLNA